MLLQKKKRPPLAAVSAYCLIRPAVLTRDLRVEKRHCICHHRIRNSSCMHKERLCHLPLPLPSAAHETVCMISLVIEISSPHDLCRRQPEMLKRFGAWLWFSLADPHIVQDYQVVYFCRRNNGNGPRLEYRDFYSGFFSEFSSENISKCQSTRDIFRIDTSTNSNDSLPVRTFRPESVSLPVGWNTEYSDRSPMLLY